MVISVKGGRRGFYSNILWYLNNCHYAEMTDSEIVFKEFSPHYCDNIEDGFYQFYRKIDIDKNKKYNKNFSHIKDLEDIRYFKNTQICGFILDEEIRKYINFLDKKYLILKPHILNKIDFLSKKLENRKVLGVHIRQTDLYTSNMDKKMDKPLDIKIYLNKIEENIKNFDLIYLMSDNKKSIQTIKEYFKNVPIFNLNTSLLSENEKDQPLFRTDNKLNKYKLGEDIILETEILSKCNKILVTNSNISSYTLIKNIEIDFEYLDLGISKCFFKNYEKILKDGI